ncbi:anhydro-N-acetylmuramic acid kinase [Paenibacillus sp. WLX1005]|uniref:anhydro-N-acetylmuramic acid kinase n=1 Tax=Paenibacillus sp. WLX1005 TaxID=3243766 RepID=UPI003983F381
MRNSASSRHHTDFCEQYRNQHEHLVIGQMSGTSLDGLDTALVRITEHEHGVPSAELCGFHFIPYPPELRDWLQALCSPQTARIDRLVQAHVGISEWHAYAVQQLLVEQQLTSDDVDLIAMHGQTVWHAPEPQPFPGPEGSSFAVRATLQIGELAIVQERTGIPVVGNFRAADMAAGGEGAPLTPYVDGLLFGSEQEGRIIQNIGGIGNATVLPAGGRRQDIWAFDTGPGNMIMDELVRLDTNGRLHYDPQGEIASSGQVNEALLSLYIDDPYYDRKPPKSTGREVYGTAFAHQFWEQGRQQSLSFPDILATATALTAATIAQAVERWIIPQHDIHTLLTCGGGSFNLTLMRMLEQRLPTGITLGRTADLGVPDEAREAMAFALLGHEALMGRTANLPAVTGASHHTILGMMGL